MKNTDIEFALGEIDPGYIAESAPENRPKKRTWIKWIAAAAAVLALAIIGGAALLMGGDVAEGLSYKPISHSDRIYKPDSAAEAMREMGLRLIWDAAGEKNPVISPLSAYFALAMAANGADGVTAEEFAALLGGDMDEVNGAVQSMAEKLAKAEEYGNIFKAANSAWIDDDARILDSFLAALENGYAAEAFSADLSTQEAVDAINSWVNEKTEGLIPKLFDDPLGEKAMMTLINTIYMNAKWKSPFYEGSTRDGQFHTSGESVTVPFMNKKSVLPYLSGKNYVGVSLPYEGDTLRFVALKPTWGTARDLLAGLTGEDMLSFIIAAEETEVNLSMPKFTVDFDMEMNNALKGMGLVSAFDHEGTADFSKMGKHKDGYPFYISKVIQKVKIIVNEEGTEAAAVTEVGMAAITGIGIQPKPKDVILDRPFVYMILDTQSGIPVFMGIMDNPA